MGSMSRNVSTFVISVDNNVQSHELPEVLVLVTKHVSVVGTVIKRWIHIWNLGVITIAVVINNGCDS
jgi:hypothetical protein